MIARLWRGVARDRRKAGAYLRHLESRVLAAIEGHRDARVLRRGYDDFVRHYEVVR